MDQNYTFSLNIKLPIFCASIAFYQIKKIPVSVSVKSTQWRLIQALPILIQ